MKLHWFKNTKSPYPYELGTVILALDNGPSEDYHYFALIQKQHPHKWNRDAAKNDIDHSKVEWIVSVPDMGVRTVCESEDEAHKTVRAILHKYAEHIHRFSQDEAIPNLSTFHNP